MNIFNKDSKFYLTLFSGCFNSEGSHNYHRWTLNNKLHSGLQSLEQNHLFRTHWTLPRCISFSKSLLLYLAKVLESKYIFCYSFDHNVSHKMHWCNRHLVLKFQVWLIRISNEMIYLGELCEYHMARYFYNDSFSYFHRFFRMVFCFYFWNELWRDSHL